MSGFPISNADSGVFHSFHGSFNGAPVVIKYEVEISQTLQSSSTRVLLIWCLINGRQVDLREDAQPFPLQQIDAWRREAVVHSKARRAPSRRAGFGASVLPITPRAPARHICAVL